MIRARRPYRLGFILGLVLIWVLFLPSADPRGMAVDWRPPSALLIVVALLAFLALARRKLAPGLRWVLAGTLILLAGLQFADGKVEQVLDRRLDLYFDLRHIPNLMGLYLDAAGWRGIAVITAVILAAALILILVERSLNAIDRAMERPDNAARALLVAFVGLVLLAVPVGGGGVIDGGAFAVLARQSGAAWRAFTVLHGLDGRYDTALTAPQPAPGPLPGLKGHDVYLVFVESYGTVALDEPAYRKVLSPELGDFAATVQAAGYQLVSSRLVSPTYGGGSWLAHGTLASGVKLDQVLNELIVQGDRKSLPRYLSAAGYRTVEVMPGIKEPYPEGAFWGFDAHYYAAELGYSGPQFGWFGIPDQYTLAQFSARELTPGHKPLFAQLVLVSSHTPFAPVPPYLADWSDAGAFKSVPQADWAKIYTPPDWNDLDPDYLASIAYDLKTLGAWLARLDGAPLVIILGDHQPPELTTGTDHPWTVPIYLLSRDPDLLKPFAALGYGSGDDPPQQANPEGMEKFLGEFLAAYGGCPASHDGGSLDSHAACATPCSASHDGGSLDSHAACATPDASPPGSALLQSPAAQAASQP